MPFDNSATELAGAPDPRLVTRGSFSASPLKLSDKSERDKFAIDALLNAFFFDWWQATLPNKHGKSFGEPGGEDECRAIGSVIDWAEGQGLRPGQPGSGRNGYRSSIPFMRPGSLEAVVTLATGSASQIMPNLCLTGAHGACASLAAEAREAFPGARLSRADTALDWSQEGLWDELHRMAKTLAKANPKLGGVRTITSDTGRTFYVGSGKSTVSLRVYEKDRERAARGVIAEEDVDPDLIRIEFSFRPQSKSKAGMAKLEPGQMIRSSVWAREFMSRAAEIMDVTENFTKLGKQEVEREVTEKTLQGTVEHGVSQYGRALARLAAWRIVERDFGGSYTDAVISPEEITGEVLDVVAELFPGTGAAMRVIEEERLEAEWTAEELRDDLTAEVVAIPVAENEARDNAQALVARIIADRFGPPDEESGEASP